MAPDASTQQPSADALDRIKSALGPKGWTDAPDALERWLKDQRGLYSGRCALLAQPATADGGG